MVAAVGLKIASGLKSSLLSKKVTNMTASDLAKIVKYTAAKANNPLADSFVKTFKADKGGKPFGRALNQFFKEGRKLLSEKKSSAVKNYCWGKKIARKGKINKSFLMNMLKKEGLPKNATIGDIIKASLEKISPKK